MNARKARAWGLVSEYIHTRWSEITPAQQAQISKHLDEQQIPPLAALVEFELARRRLSYNTAATLIARQMPDEVANGRALLSPSAIFYFKKPKRPNWRAERYTLEQLAFAFGWSIDWLHQVNRDWVDDLTNPDPDIAEVAAIMRSLPAHYRSGILTFARSSMQGSQMAEHAEEINTPSEQARVAAS
jgi:hypothetical protein